MKTITKLGAFATAGLLSAGLATAASTSGKEGMQPTAGHTHHDSIGSGLPMLATGVQELSLGGHLNWEDSASYNFDVSYGRFVTPNWLLGVQGGLTGLNSDKDYRAGVFAEYNYLTGTKWVPFIRSGLGYSNPDQGDDGFFIGADAGIKYFFRPNLAVYGSMGGDWDLSNNGSSDGIAKQIDVGLKFYF